MNSTPYSPTPAKITDKDLAEVCAKYHLLVAQPSQADALAVLGINVTVYSVDSKTVYPSDTRYTHLWIEYLAPSADILRILAPVKQNVKLITVPQNIEALYSQQRISPDADNEDRTYAIYEHLSQESPTGLQFLADRVKRARDHNKRIELLTLIDLWRSQDSIGRALSVAETRTRAGINQKEWQTIANVYTPKSDPNRKTIWSAAELADADFPQPEEIVQGLIPPGLIIKAGRPKSGKSYFALQLSVCAASGSPFLGRATQKCKVLYCALEDSPRRIQQRMIGQRAFEGIKASELDIIYEFDIPPLSGQGTAYIYERIQKEGFGLVIIDTFTRAAGRADQMDQVEMAVCMNALHQIALKENVAIIIIDHHRKNTGFSGDVIDDILGATSKSGVVDTAIGLYKERGTDQAILKATGRDLDQDVELVLRFDQKTLQWTCIGKAEEVITSQVQQEILDAIKDEFGSEATTAELADHLGKDRGQISRHLKALTESGHLTRCPRKNKQTPYRLNNEPSSSELQKSSGSEEES